MSDRNKIVAFSNELEVIINKHGIDSILNIPDWILRGHIEAIIYCLKDSLQERDDWFGFKPLEHLESALRNK